jgi:hypothetical protein
VAGFQAVRGAHEPTPFCEGDLDREVLGLKVWPQRSQILLDQTGDKLRVTAGGLLGLTPGSILAVHPPVKDARDPKTVLGHLKVLSVTPTAAEVEPCAFNKKPAVKAAELPKLATCSLLVQEIGDLRLKVAVGKGTGADGKQASAVQQKRAANLAAALQQLSEETKKLVLITPDAAAAEWVLWLDGDKVQLRQGDGRSSVDSKEDALAAKARAQGKGATRTIFGKYDADDPKAIAQGLDRDLVKIFTWQNVWRIAGAGKNEDADDSPSLKVEVVKLKGKATPDGTLDPAATVKPGQRIELRLKNEGYDDLWVTVLFLDANFGIDVFFSDGVKAQAALKPMRGTISKNSYGKEGFVVLAVPMKVQKNRPDFAFLEQSPLEREEVKSRGIRKRSAGEVAATPFERLMPAAAFGAPGTRSIERDVPTNPATLVRSWVTLPTAAGAGAKQP